MPLMLMSNPGLHVALLGNPGRTKRGRRIHSRSTTRSRRNPMSVATLGKSYVAAAKKTPTEVLGVLKGRHKIRSALFTAGGAVGMYALGGVVTASALVPALNAIGAGPLLANQWGKRIVGGLVPFTLGFGISRFLKGDLGKAALVGGGLASILELAAPGMIARLVYRAAPVAVAAAPVAAVKGPVNGMDGIDGYVDAKAYQGTGGYVDAKAYQGTGDVEDQMDGYVDAKAYQGTGDVDDDLASDDLAGVDGYLTDASKFMETYLN